MAELNWIDKNERLPTKDDANSAHFIYVLNSGYVESRTFDAISNVAITHWLPFREMPVPKRWRVPTIHDLAKAGKPIPCRVKGITTDEWREAELTAVHIEPRSYRYFANNEWWFVCEICDE